MHAIQCSYSAGSATKQPRYRVLEANSQNDMQTVSIAEPPLSAISTGRQNMSPTFLAKVEATDQHCVGTARGALCNFVRLIRLTCIIFPTLLPHIYLLN